MELEMGCGGSKKEAREVGPAATVLRTQLYPVRKPLRPQQEREGKLPLVVLEGMAKILNIPSKAPRRPRIVRKPAQNTDSLFGNRIADPIANAASEKAAILTAETDRKDNQLREKAQDGEGTHEAATYKPRKKEEIPPLEGKAGAFEVDTEQFAALNKETGGTQAINSAAKTPKVTINQSSVTDFWPEAAIAALPMTASDGNVIRAEESVVSRDTLLIQQQKPRPGTSQQLAAARLEKEYNQERGVSPEPSKPVGEESDEEDEDYGAVDEARRAARLAQEKLSEEEAARLAAERRAEDERILASKAALMDAKRNEADSILAKYL